MSVSRKSSGVWLGTLIERASLVATDQGWTAGDVVIVVDAAPAITVETVVQNALGVRSFQPDASVLARATARVVTAPATSGALKQTLLVTVVDGNAAGVVGAPVTVVWNGGAGVVTLTPTVGALGALLGPGAATTEGATQYKTGAGGVCNVTLTASAGDTLNVAVIVGQVLVDLGPLVFV